MYNETQINNLRHVKQLLQVTADYIEQCLHRDRIKAETDSIEQIKDVLKFDLDRIERTINKINLA